MLDPNIPLLEFDPAPRAIINPDMINHRVDAPKKAVPCFFFDIIEQLKLEGWLELFENLHSEMGPLPIYQYITNGHPILVYQAGLGAALSAGILEEVIAMGANQFIACGGCGVLDDHVDVGHPFIITSAVRDEGVSYHYLMPSREVNAHEDAIRVLKMTLDQHHLPYNLTKTWTTDAIYRETVDKRARRFAEGCEIVEMEAAAFFAVAEFRKVIFGQIVYGGDLVKPDNWDGRKWNSRTATRRLLFDLAVEAVLQL
ncbi:MAG: nucleoside phosphorylase [Anaerolineaceae bacterium]